MKIGIVIATWHEVPKLFYSETPPRGRNPRVFNFDGKEITLLVTGIGQKNAQRAIINFLSTHKVHQILHVGFAGSLKNYVKPCYLVVADKISCRQGEIIYCDDVLVEDVRRALEKNVDFHIGGIWTSSGLATETDKIPTEFIASDMESYWIGKEVREREIPFLAVKAITDQVFPSRRRKLPQMFKSLLTFFVVLKNSKRAKTKLEILLKSYLVA